MVATDEEALICDFAETYHIYDYRALPLRLAAIYANGLRPNARIMMKLAGTKAPAETLLLSMIADGINTRIWQNSKNARESNRPTSITAKFIQKDEERLSGFDSADEFDAWRKSMIGG